MPCVGECHRKSKARVSSNNSDDAEDNIWGSDEEQINSYADLQRAHVSQGYLDGITQAQEQGLQEGFDTGFPLGAELGKLVGRILARLHGSSEFNSAKQALNITNVLDKKYFDSQLDPTESRHPLILYWESIAEI